MTEIIHQHNRVESSAPCEDGESLRNPSQARPIEDDRYPGSFFRVPGIPKPGKTTWSIAK